MFEILLNVCIFLILAALVLILITPILFLIGALIYVGSALIHMVLMLFNYFAIQYISRHIDQAERVELYPLYQTYKRVDVPTGYSTDGLYKRWYYQYKYIPKGNERKAKVCFENSRTLTVFFKERSPVYQQIMIRGGLVSLRS